MINWIKEKLFNGIMIYQFLMWSHWLYAITIFVAWVSGEIELNLDLFVPVVMIAILSHELIKEKKKNDS